MRTLVETDALSGERGAYRLGHSVDKVQIPATVQVILAARIDRLAPEDKQLLQAAAVIGKDVPLALLEDIAEVDPSALRASLARLQAAEFLFEATLFPNLEYTFKHALTHEVAYGGLLTERKRALHTKWSSPSRQSTPSGSASTPSGLAHHSVRGGLKDKAVAYLNEVGTKALMRSGYREAIGLFEQGLRILDGAPQSQDTLARVVELRTGLGLALAATKGPQAPDVQAFYTRSLGNLPTSQRCTRSIPSPVRIVELPSLRLRSRSCKAAAVELLGPAGDKDGYQRLEAHHAMWTTKINLGRPAESIEHLEYAPLLHDAANQSKWRIYANHDPLVCSHSMGAIAHWALGNFDRARRLASEGVRLAMQIDHPLTRVIATMEAALVFFQCGDADSTRRHAESAMRFGQDFDFPLGESERRLPWRG